MFYKIVFKGLPDAKIEKECKRVFKKLNLKLEIIHKRKFGFQRLQVEIVKNMGILIAAQASTEFNVFSGKGENYSIKINQRLFQRNLKHLEQVFAHEIAHLAVSHLFEMERSHKIGHGKEWQKIMRDFGYEPDPNHDLPLPDPKSITLEERIEFLVPLP